MSSSQSALLGHHSIPSRTGRGSSYYSYSTGELFAELVGRHRALNPPESTIVRSAWIGKLTQSAKHEFILFQVEHRGDEKSDGGGTTNYLVLDRDPLNILGVKSFVRALVFGERVVDQFRVSYDGDAKQLLDDCNLSPHRILEHLRFPLNEPLHLHQLVSVAYSVSIRHPKCRAVYWDCYVFTGLIWDSLYVLSPTATLDKFLKRERGRYGWFCYRPARSKVEETARRALDGISRVHAARPRADG